MSRFPEKEVKEAPRRLALEKIVAKCVDRYLGLGFHIFIYPDVSEEEAVEKYRKDFSIPGGASKPEEYDSRFDVYYAVEPRVSLSRKHKRAGISELTDTLKISNSTHIPDKPYIAFTHDGTLYLPYTVNQAVRRFSEDEVGESQTETTDLYLNHPVLFAIFGRDAAGSRTEYGNVPSLVAFFGRPRVEENRPGASHQHWGVGSRGKKIIELGT